MWRQIGACVCNKKQRSWDDITRAALGLFHADWRVLCFLRVWTQCYGFSPLVFGHWTQPVSQHINDETEHPHCEHIMLDTFWVLFLTNHLKQDPACPGACVPNPQGMTVVVLGTLASGHIVGGETGGKITVLYLSYLQGRRWDLAPLEKWWKPPRTGSPMQIRRWRWLLKC